MDETFLFIILGVQLQSSGHAIICWTHLKEPSQSEAVVSGILPLREITSESH